MQGDCTMSSTIIDMPKVTQMLDNGWQVELFKNQMGSYTARGQCMKLALWERAKNACLEQTLAANSGPDGMSRESLEEINDIDFDNPGVIDTDDFTPEQALTRLAYKVHGEIL